MQSGASTPTTRNQGCLLATLAVLLACALLVVVPAIYGFSRYKAAQVYADTVAVSTQPTTLPTQPADAYTLTLQPQVSAPGGVDVGFTLSDSFGRTLAASTDFYTTGCPASGVSNQTCPAESRDFSFHNTLGGRVMLVLASTQPGISVSVAVRDDSLGGLFASGSVATFAAVLGCGSLLWVVSAAIVGVAFRRATRPAKGTT
jgi:hypothetical protein